MMALTIEMNLIVATKINNILIKGFLILGGGYGIYLIWIVLALGGGSSRMEGEIHYIPKGYTGKVYIILDESDGEGKEYLDGFRVYRIPKSGILRTKFERNTGWISSNEELKFYYYDKDSTYFIPKRISSRDLKYNKDSTKIMILQYGYGGAYTEFLLDKPILTYNVDSLKNTSKKTYLLTKEMYENWDK